MSDQEILYAADVARLVGKSQNAFTAAMKRDSNAVPPGKFKMGRLWAWRRATVMEWLSSLEGGAGAPEAIPARKRGRPRSTPVSPQALRG